MTANGLESVSVSSRIHTNDVYAAHRFALAGLGVTWLAVWLVENDLRAGRLVRVLESAAPPSVDVFASFHKQGRSAGAVRVVLDHLASEASR